MSPLESPVDEAQEIARNVIEEAARRACHPRATYRLEFHKSHFRFRDAIELVPYLSQLGISHVYASPILKVASDATHRYCTVNYSELDPQLGTREEFQDLVQCLKEEGMGIILDIVPNHMSTSEENNWWIDVLEHGPSSLFADFFDIDWNPVEKSLKNKILLPILGDAFGEVLEAGELKVNLESGAFRIQYYSHSLPVDPRSYPIILEKLRDQLTQAQPSAETSIELESILTALHHLPPRTDVTPAGSEERQRETLVIKSRLKALLEGDADCARALQKVLEQLNGEPGNSASFDPLEQLLDCQAYRLSSWKAASDEINYRRFFDVNELAAVCTEKMVVFEQSHQLILDMLVNEEIQGLRIDHVDGLFDPGQYLWRLQWSYLLKLGKKLWRDQHPEESDQDWMSLQSDFLRSLHREFGGPDPFSILDLAVDDAVHERPPLRVSKENLPLYLLVEKILGPEESLPAEWPVMGTTGYDFLNTVNGLFIDGAGAAKLRRSYARFTERRDEFDVTARNSKRLILDVSMSSELHLLATRLKRIAEHDRYARDFTLKSLTNALSEVIVHFTVYRTYLRPGSSHSDDRKIVMHAVEKARRANPAMDARLFEFIGDLLMNQATEANARQLEIDVFIGRFQQVTSPVMAKGVEDTAFYRDIPLLSMNEVGSHPPSAVVSLSQFHHENERRLREFPATLLCSSTHDTKRSEDVRSRINCLSEIPDVWRTSVGRWRRWNRRFLKSVHGNTAPDRNDEYLFYQTLLGIWPAGEVDSQTHDDLRERIHKFMVKAVHEAKEQTSWISPDEEYEQAVKDFIDGALRQSTGNRFLQDMGELVARISEAGLINSAAQLVLKLTVPGTPDVFQGQERWDDSLVDPDNRRPVDFPQRKVLLDELKDELEHDRRSVIQRLAQNPADHRFKLFVLWSCLQARAASPSFFHSGSYSPLEVDGAIPESICAFARAARWGDRVEAIVVAVPRLTLRYGKQNESDVPVTVNLLEGTPRRYWNIFTRNEIRADDGILNLSEHLKEFPLIVMTTWEP
ncbi:malto-oligosyltrehalose synthase [Planctomicrobium sp. SH661]|uniref:malto-oligosyltrehalose synthase n=1 Tax=Planctomicrobium sp. SH661 TaxID=3448124 RepID=UPI003F5B7E1B